MSPDKYTAPFVVCETSTGAAVQIGLVLGVPEQFDPAPSPTNKHAIATQITTANVDAAMMISLKKITLVQF